MPSALPHARLLLRRASRAAAVAPRARGLLAAVGLLAACGPAVPPGDRGPTQLEVAVTRLRAIAHDVDDVPAPVRVRAAGDGDGDAPVPPTRAGARRPRPPVAGVPWWADSAHWSADVVRWTTTQRPALVLWAGDTAALPTPDVPAALPDALRARGVYWASDDAAVVAVVPAADGAAVVTAHAPGAARLVAQTAAGLTVTPVVVRAIVRGRLHPADGAPPPRARIVVTRRTAAAVSADTVWSDARGAFALPLVDDAAGPADASDVADADARVAVDVRIEPTPGDGDRFYFDAELRALPADRLHALGVVLVPTRWTIAAGSYAGRTVAVRPAAARGRGAGGGRFWRTTRAWGAPGRSTGDVPVGWPDDAVPLAVALDDALTPTDSAHFWAAAHTLERDWGRALFRPAPPDAPASEAAGRVRVGLAPGMRAAGFTDASWSGRGEIGGATVALRTHATVADAGVVTHELLHALGFGHVGAWPSVMTPAAGPADRATPDDVAHGHLFEAARHLARTRGADYGLTDAVSDSR